MSDGGRPVEPLLIGWKEHAAFPEWGLRRLRVKIDSGACTSALDVAGYDLEERPAGTVARFRLQLRRRHPERARVIEAPVLRFANVLCTSGVCERRPVVETLLRLG